MTNTYHAAHFDPTVDEIDVLKRLEMGEVITQDGALKEHLSGRLLEWGLISKKADGEMAITPGAATDSPAGQLSSLWRTSATRYQPPAHSANAGAATPRGALSPSILAH